MVFGPVVLGALLTLGPATTEGEAPVLAAAEQATLARLLVSPAELQARLTALGGPVLVDVRPEASYRRVRIPGSLNIPLFAVKTRGFLRGRALVLIDEGFEAQRLEEQCGTIAAHGVGPVSVLDGGLVAWAATGGPLAGDAAHLGAARSVSPAVFAAERARRVLPVVYAGRDPELARRLVPEAVRLPEGAGVEALRARLDEAAGAPDRGRTRTVLIVGDRGEEGQRLALLAAERSAGADRVDAFFFLEGGLEALAAFREQQAALAVGNEGVRRVGCPSCPEGQAR